MTIYVLYDVSRSKAYLWSLPSRNDTGAMLKARQLLEGSIGHLFMGPTGKDEMHFLSVVTKGSHRKL